MSLSHSRQAVSVGVGLTVSVGVGGGVAIERRRVRLEGMSKETTLLGRRPYNGIVWNAAGMYTRIS
jgi:predicted NBD/HSP70 family sugar kinase